MGFRMIGKPRIEKLTHELAKEFSEMQAVPRDRALKRYLIQQHLNSLAAGRFHSCRWIVGYYKGQKFRVNGKHTSVMFTEMDKADIPNLWITIEDYECDTEEDLARLYNSVDNVASAKGAVDQYLSIAGVTPELKDLAKNTICAAVAGMTEALGLNAHPAHERVGLLIENKEFVLWLDNLLAGRGTTGRKNGKGKSKPHERNSRHLQRAAVTGVMFLSWKISVSHATEFWSLVRDQNGHDPEDPDRRLANYLLLARINKTGSKKKADQATTREMYVKCIKYWNAWRRGETTNAPYRPDQPIPPLI